MRTVPLVGVAHPDKKALSREIGKWGYRLRERATVSSGFRAAADDRPIELENKNKEDHGLDGQASPAGTFGFATGEIFGEGEAQLTLMRKRLVSPKSRGTEAHAGYGKPPLPVYTSPSRSSLVGRRKFVVRLLACAWNDW